jgi:hypothetical protein
MVITLSLAGDFEGVDQLSLAINREYIPASIFVC